MAPVVEVVLIVLAKSVAEFFDFGVVALGGTLVR